MFVQTLVLVAALYVVDVVLRRRVRAVVRYWLWALVLLKLLLPVTLRTPASAADWLLREPVPAVTASTTPRPEIPTLRSIPSTSSADPFRISRGVAARNERQAGARRPTGRRAGTASGASVASPSANPIAVRARCHFGEARVPPTRSCRLDFPRLVRRLHRPGNHGSPPGGEGVAIGAACSPSAPPT